MAILLPAKTKFRKVHKGRNRGLSKGNTTLSFGEFGIQALERGSIPAAQIEAARIAISRHVKRRGKMWLRVFPHKPVTKKPAETRMGRGKGGVEYWVVVVKPGTVLFELSGVSPTIAREAMSLADSKLAVRCRFLNREVLAERF
jgi:large subunit ribosomal protein L16